MPDVQAADLGVSVEAEGATQVGPEMTYEEFLEWADDRHLEWVNNRAYLLPAPSTRHQRITGFFTQTLGIYVEENSLGEVISSPFQMELETGREPDVLFVAAEHEERLLENRLNGEGRYRTVRPDDEGVYRSEVVDGFWLDAAWLWQEPLPKVTEVLRAWGLFVGRGS